MFTLKNWILALLCSILIGACSVPSNNLSNDIDVVEEDSSTETQIIENDLITVEPQFVTATPFPTQTKKETLAIIPFNYQLKDAGDGWNEGSISIAFENRDDFIFYTEFAEASDVIWNPYFSEADGNPILETNEGIEYPVSLITSTGSINKIKIPPGFRFADTGRTTQISWKSASAATPKRIVFKNNPELSFDIPSNQNEFINFPYDSPPVPIKSFSSLKDVYLVNDANGISAKFTGRCGNSFWFNPHEATNFENGNTMFLEITSINNNQFDDVESVYDYPYSYTIFGEDGLVEYQDHFGHTPYVSNSIELGPAQSATIYVPIANENEFVRFDPKSAIVVIFTAAGYDVYEVGECQYAPPLD